MNERSQKEAELKKLEEQQQEDIKKLEKLQETADELRIDQIKNKLGKLKRDEQTIQMQTTEYINMGLQQNDAEKLAELGEMLEISKKRMDLLEKAPEGLKDRTKMLETTKKLYEENFQKFNNLLTEARERASQKVETKTAKEESKPEKKSEEGPKQNETESKTEKEGDRAGDTAEFELNQEGLNEEEEISAGELITKNILELGIEKILPPEFANLEEGQKIFILKNLKNRIVDIVKSDAQTQYSEYLKEKMVKSEGGNRASKIFKGIQNIGIGLKEKFKQEVIMKNLENKVFNELLNTEENKKLISEDLEMLTKNAKEKTIQLDSENNPTVIYLDPKDTEIENLTFEEAKAISEYNSAANKFREIPYEWGQEGKTILAGHKRKYEDAKEKYNKARDIVLEIKSNREKKGEKGKAITEMLQLDNALQLDQLLNTHPELEKEFDNLSKDAGFKDYLTSGKGFGKNLIGRGGVNALLTGAGFTLRMGTKLVAGITATSTVAASSITFVAAPIIGGSVGALRARFRGKETLAQRQKEARYGKKDENKEAKNIVDAKNLTERMNDTIKAVENATTPEKKNQYLDQLKRRINYTQEKIENGLVNFGDNKSVLNNQFNLVNNLNNALILSSSLEETTRKDVDERLEDFLLYKKEKINEAQKKFIHKQMRKGALMGAGFATAGYGVRYLGEHFGWWGQPSGEKALQNITETNPEDLKKIDPEVIKIIKSIENLGTEKVENIQKIPFPVLEKLDADTIKEIGKLDPAQIENIVKISPDTLKELDTDSIIKLSKLSPDSISKISSLDSTTIKDTLKLSGTELQKALDLAKATQLKEQIIQQMNPATKSSAIVEHLEVKAVADHGQGAISTLRELQNNLKAEYGNNLENAPTSVKHILNTDAQKLAQEYGMYKPGEGDESAFIKSGSSFEVDKSGNVTYHEAGGKSFVLEKGTEMKPSNTYEGKMFDSDSSHDSQIEHQGQGEIGSKAPETISENLKGIDHPANIKPVAPEIQRVNPNEIPTEDTREATMSGKSGFKRVNFEDHPQAEKLIQVNQTYEQNINHLFPNTKSLEVWTGIKNSTTLYPAEKLLNWTGDTNETLKPLLSFMHKIHETTGIKPRVKNIFHQAESPEEYILRGLKKAGKMGKLDDLKS
jgi:hypothetical protein